MNFIHVVNGDSAAAQLSAALAQASRQDRVITLHDDLTVGPLRQVDEMPAPRIAFWQRVLDAHEHGLSQSVQDAVEAGAAALRGLLADDDRELAVWHARNAADQLMLRRVAYLLRGTPQRLNEIAITAPSLIPAATLATNAEPRSARTGLTGRPTDDDTHGHVPAHDQRDSLDRSLDYSPAASRHASSLIADHLLNVAPISILRISRLALEWQEMKQLDHEVRQWHDHTFQSGTFADIDHAILAASGDAWKPYRQIGAAVRERDPANGPSDTVLAWRCRELRIAGRLELDGDPVLADDARLRRRH